MIEKELGRKRPSPRPSATAIGASASSEVSCRAASRISGRRATPRTESQQSMMKRGPALSARIPPATRNAARDTP
jgi:hypothetical protein